jgi:hypothetical protein
MLTPLIAAALALQETPAQPAPAPGADVIAIEELPIREAAAARCALAYATIGQWQKTGDARGAAYPDVNAGGGREFFVRVMAQLMDTGLTRESIVTITARGFERNNTPEGAERIAQMMPACELMKSAAGL